MVIFNKKQMTIKKAVKHIEEIISEYDEIRVVSNPYNNFVLRIDAFIYDKNHIPQSIDVFWVENLTNLTELYLYNSIDKYPNVEFIHGRYW
jgi:hypothetical protein